MVASVGCTSMVGSATTVNVAGFETVVLQSLPGDVTMH